MTKYGYSNLFLTVTTFIVFYNFIPIKIINFSPMFIAIIGALFFTFFLHQFVVNCKHLLNVSRFKKGNSLIDTNSPMVVVPGIAMVMVFVLNFSTIEASLLIEDGEFVIGNVIDGSGVKNIKGNGTYDLTVKFKTRNGEDVIVTEDVSEGEFRSSKNGDIIELIYSKRDSKIVELLFTDEDKKKYLFTDVEKELEIKDLLLMTNKDNEILGEGLNKLNYIWKFNMIDSTWENKIKKLSVKTTSKNSIILNSNEQNETYVKQLLKLNFKLIKNDSSKIYENDKFLVKFFHTDVVIDSYGNKILLGTELEILNK
jgi:hypothetical protein